LGIGESTANYIFHRWVKSLRDLLPASELEQVKKMIHIGNGLLNIDEVRVDSR
jgi:hypothetical protein